MIPIIYHLPQKVFLRYTWKKEKKIKLHLCSLLGQNTSTDTELPIK